MKTVFFRCLVVTALSFVATQILTAADAAHFANGVKVGEVTSESAIVWTRLTADT